MDWLTLLLIFIFFILPLIQQVMEARKRGGAPIETEDSSGEEDWLPLEEVDFEGTAENRPKQGQGEWSEGWGSWPTEPSPEPRREPEPLHRAGREGRAAESRPEQPWSKPAPAPAPKPAEIPWRLPEPVVTTPEPVRKSKPEESEIPWRVPEPKRSPPSITPAPKPYVKPAPALRRREAPPLEPLPRRRGGEMTHLQKLRDTGEIKKIIIMTEILRPPKALDGF
jgi:hypothetical protein